MTVFSTPKGGNADHDWEDKALVRRSGRDGLRFLVLDGATEGIDTVRWVDLIAASYAPASRHEAVPLLERGAMGVWFRDLQQRWADAPPAFVNLMEELKFHDKGALATMLAGTVTGLDTPCPAWRAIALGDTVLFHVRGDRLVEHFPPLTAADFDLHPPGLSTQPAKLDEMVARLKGREGLLEAGDVLFVATDALALWMVRRLERDPEEVFALLSGLDHPDSFDRLVADWRAVDGAVGGMVDDDVTLLRLRFSDTDPSHLVVCL